MRPRGMGCHLQSLGLHPGDRVAVMLPNVPQYPVAVLAILRAGFVLVNVNPFTRPASWSTNSGLGGQGHGGHRELCQTLGG